MTAESFEIKGYLNMQDFPKLTPRLETVASFVRDGVVVADIGTDHAYVPVYLVNKGICKNAIACDIVEGPLSRAKQTAKEFHAEDRVKFVLADGMSGIKKHDADDIVIAGMGGELISKIMNECSFAKDSSKHFILQPMTAHEDLRKYLCDNGYIIKKENIVTERNENKVYTVMSVYYKDLQYKYEDYYYYVGEVLQSKSEQSALYINKVIKSLKKHKDGILKSNEKNENEIKRLSDLINKISGLIEG